MLISAKDIQSTYNITPLEVEFFQMCFRYKDKHRAYLESHPDCVSTNKPSIDAMACRLYSKIMSKFQGDFKSMFELAGLGVNRLAQEIENGLNALTVKTKKDGLIKNKDGSTMYFEDNTNRARTRELLAKVLGVSTDKVIEVHKDATADLDLSKLDSNELNDLQALLTKAKKD